MAYSTDCTRISRDKAVQIWNAMSGVPICRPLEGHSGPVQSVAFSPDGGTRIASGFNDNTVRIWNAATGTPFDEPLLGHPGIVRSVAFSPNSTLLVSGSEDRTIRVWDTVSGMQIGDGEPLIGHALEVYSVTFSPDSTHILSGSRDPRFRHGMPTQPHQLACLYEGIRIPFGLLHALAMALALRQALWMAHMGWPPSWNNGAQLVS